MYVSHDISSTPVSGYTVNRGVSLLTYRLKQLQETAAVIRERRVLRHYPNHSSLYIVLIHCVHIYDVFTPKLLMPNFSKLLIADLVPKSIKFSLSLTSHLIISMASAQLKTKSPAKGGHKTTIYQHGTPQLSRVQCRFAGEFKWYITSDSVTAPLTFLETKQSDDETIASGEFPQGYVLDQRTTAADGSDCGAWLRGLDKDGEPSTTSYRLVFVSRNDDQATLCLQSVSSKGKVK